MIRIRSASGTDFDRMFLPMMISQHRRRSRWRSRRRMTAKAPTPRRSPERPSLPRSSEMNTCSSRSAAVARFFSGSFAAIGRRCRPSTLIQLAAPGGSDGSPSPPCWAPRCSSRSPAAATTRLTMVPSAHQPIGRCCWIRRIGDAAVAGANRGTCRVKAAGLESSGSGVTTASRSVLSSAEWLPTCGASVTRTGPSLG